MAGAIYERGPSIEPTRHAGDRLRIEKLHTSKGIGIMTACIAAMALTIAVVFAMASGVGPEVEESRGSVREELDRPMDAIDDPRTIGDRAEQ